MLNNKGAVLSSDLSKNINNMVRPTQERKMAQAKRAWHLEIIKLIRLGAYREVERRYGPKGLQSAIDYVKAERYPITSASNSSIETSGRKKPFFVHPQIPEDAQVMARERILLEYVLNGVMPLLGIRTNGLGEIIYFMELASRYLEMRVH